MKRRNIIKNISYGIMDSFMSRNNDINGYWALGIFYKVAAENNQKHFVLDLISKVSDPYYKYSANVASRYKEFIDKQLAKPSLDSIKIIHAQVQIEFNVPAEKKHIERMITWGKPFNLKVTLEDENHKLYIAQTVGWCDKHNPNKERRSIKNKKS